MSKLSAPVVVALLVSGVVLFTSSNLHAQIVRVSAPHSSVPTAGVGFGTSAKSRSNLPLFVMKNTSEDSCQIRQDAVSGIAQGGNYQQMYDSSRACIEQCANAAVFPPIWADFGAATAGCQDMSTDPNRWPPYREWLKKVLYYNLDSNYYCEDVQAILSAFQYFNAERGYDYNGALAVTQFLLDSARCLSFAFMENVASDWAQTRRDQYQIWRDSANNPKLTPFSQDTILPSLEDLDLGLLRGPQYAAVKNAFSPSSGTKLLYLKASENPFTNETSLLFGLTDAEYMRVDVYDVLGNTLYTDTHLYGEGSNSWVLPAPSLPRGTLYARLSAMNGEVKTIKLVRE